MKSRWNYWLLLVKLIEFYLINFQLVYLFGCRLLVLKQYYSKFPTCVFMKTVRGNSINSSDLTQN